MHNCVIHNNKIPSRLLAFCSQAEANDMVILYPQTFQSNCWDWNGAILRRVAFFSELSQDIPESPLTVFPGVSSRPVGALIYCGVAVAQSLVVELQCMSRSMTAV